MNERWSSRPVNVSHPSPRYLRLCTMVGELADAADASLAEVWDAYDEGKLQLVHEGAPPRKAD